MLSRLSLLFVTRLILCTTTVKESFGQTVLRCDVNEERRICGPKCPITCDTLNTNVCCDVTCVAGCFCQDGYILVSNTGPRKCVPFNDCPKPGIIEFRDLTLTVWESSKVAEVIVLRLNGSAGEISVGWRTERGTAVEQSDFVQSSGILVFPEGVIYRIVTIEVIDDSVREADEFFSVILSDPTNKAEINPRISEGLRIIIKDDDMRPGYIEVENANITVPENFGTVLVTLVRLQGHDGVISMQYRTVDGTARAQVDYVPMTGQVIFNEGERRIAVPVSLINDAIFEPVESFQVQFFNPTVASDVINFRQQRSSLSTTITILDDDMRPGYIELESINVTVPENFGTTLMALNRVDGVDGVISIQYRTVDGTARAQADYVPVTGVVTFNGGERKKNVQIAIIDDNVWEPTESFQLQFFNPTTALDVINFRQQSSRLTAIITIIDNDMRPGYIELENLNITVPENFGTVPVILNRIGGTHGVISIQYRTVDSTAQAKTDYVPVSGVVTFNGGESRKTIPLIIIDDNVWEPTESFQLQFFNPTATLDVINFRQQSSRLTTIVTIIDNDRKPGYIEMETTTITVEEKIGTVNVNLVRLGGTDGQIRIRYRTVDGTALARSDYMPITGDAVFTGGEKIKSISVSIIDDAVRETSENFQLVLFDPTAASDVVNFRFQNNRLATTIIILDDDMTPGYLELEQTNFTVKEDYGKLQVGIVRIGGTDGVLKMKYRTVDVTANAKLDYEPTTGDLIFEEGESKKTIDIAIVSDDVRESQETFELLIYDFAAGSDTINFRAQGRRLTALITIIDDDAKIGYLEISNVAITVPENVGSISINVVRKDGQDGEIRVRYRTVDGTAKAPSDYTFRSGVLVFRDGVTLQQIAIGIVNDDVMEPTENFRLELFESSAAPDVFNFRSLSSKTSTSITIVDDDMKPGYLELEQVNFTVKEDHGTLQVIVVRVGGTDGILNMKYRTVDVTATAQSDYLPALSDLVFRDGESKKSINIVILNDDLRESVETFQLHIFDFTAGSETINFRALGTRLTAVITIIDDDDNGGVFEFQSVRLTVPESIGILSLTIVRKDGFNGRVSLQLRTMGSTATESVDYIPPPLAVVFPDGVTEMTIRIQIVDDDIKEADESFFVGIFNPTNGGILGTNKLVTVVIADDDDPSIIRFYRRSGNFREQDGFVDIPVVRETWLDRRVSVYFRTEDRSARDGENYRGTSGTLINFGPRESRKVLRISILADSYYENSDLFDVVLFNASEGAVLGEPSRYTVQLLDFRRASPPVTARSSISSAARGVRVSFPVQNIRVKESVGAVRVSILRSGDMTSPFTVNIRTVDGSAIAGRDYRRVDGSLSFKRGDSQIVIAVRIINDNTVEPEETFTLQLLEPSLGTILGGKDTMTVTIVDDDDVAVSLSRGPSDVVPAQRQSGGAGLLPKCPDHLVLKECADTCPPTCSSLFGKVPCSHNGCIRGCFCPEGFVKESETSDRCVKPSQCTRGP